MKIGIFTHHWVSNFGANLQALASQGAFRDAGHEVAFINFREPDRVERIDRRVEESQRKCHSDFAKRYLTETVPIESEHHLEEVINNDFDIVVVGSDAMFEVRAVYDPMEILAAIMRKRNLPQHNMPVFFLPYSKGGSRRASLSVSCMGSQFRFFSPRQRKQLKEALSNFDFFGVRDDWTHAMVSKFCNSKINIFPDPVFSLAPDTLLTSRRESSDKRILISGIQENQWLTELCEKIRLRGYQAVGLRMPEARSGYSCTDYNIDEPLGPLEWLTELDSASGYIGEKFHALACCMLCDTPVVNVDPHRKSVFSPKSSKMYDLCRRSETLPRFNTLKQLYARSQDEILDVLFDGKLRSNAEHYTNSARREFAGQVEAILKLC